jgi:hypothetical protein
VKQRYRPPQETAGSVYFAGGKLLDSAARDETARDVPNDDSSIEPWSALKRHVDAKSAVRALKKRRWLSGREGIGSNPLSGAKVLPELEWTVAQRREAGLATVGYMTANVIGYPSQRTADQFFNVAAYAAPPIYTFGTAGRSSLRSAGFWNLDTSLFGRFSFSERYQMELRAEAFNIYSMFRSILQKTTFWCRSDRPLRKTAQEVAA